MNPFQAIMGNSTPVQAPMGNMPTQGFGGPLGALQGVMQRAQQMAQQLGNPEQLVNRFFPNAPMEVRNDPDALVNWLQQSGQVNPQMVQMARQMMGR